jgi:hypothetical protein
MQPHAFESMMRLQVRKAHLDPLPLITRFQEGLPLGGAIEDVDEAIRPRRDFRYAILQRGIARERNSDLDGALDGARAGTALIGSLTLSGGKKTHAS